MFRFPSSPFDPATTRSSSSGSGRDAPTHRQQPFRSPKVVSIPVRFVGSETSSTTATSAMPRSTAAVKIQKVWRGFLARKNVNKILGIKREVDAIEKKISDKETAELIRGDAKERLKLNEMLMALLFRLDSIRGVDLGIRDCRKRVTKKAIMLQERVDSIASGETQDSAAVDGSEDQKPLECQENSTSVQEVEGRLIDAEESVHGEQDQRSELEQEEGYLLVKREDEEMKVEESESIEESKAAGDEEIKTEEKNSKKELMEKMIERNEILIGLVSDLCEKNKMQTQMINSLSKRVDSLEKSFKSERSKCKRRKQDAKRTVT